MPEAHSSRSALSRVVQKRSQVTPEAEAAILGSAELPTEMEKPQTPEPEQGSIDLSTLRIKGSTASKVFTTRMEPTLRDFLDEVAALYSTTASSLATTILRAELPKWKSAKTE